MVTIKIESDAISDAARELAALREALRHRHGDRYRELERRIERLSPKGADVRSLDGETLAAVPPQEWTAILREGRELGVI